MPVGLVFHGTSVCFPFQVGFHFSTLLYSKAVVGAATLLGICGELNTGLHSQTKVNAGNVLNLHQAINFHEMPCVLTVTA